MAESGIKNGIPKKVGKCKAIIAAIVGVAMVVAGVAFWYVNIKMPYDAASARFETSVTELEKKNAELDTSIQGLQSVIDSGEKPLEGKTLELAGAAIGTAQGAKVTVPDMPSTVDEINAMADELSSAGDYSDVLSGIADAQSQLENSIAQMKLVTNPSEQYVIEHIQGLPNITGVQAVTEDHDPNGKLHKSGGYTSTVYFSSDLVTVQLVEGDIVDRGTEGGGAVEVYASIEDAQSRDAYLGALDGSVLSSGSHTVVGTCVVRTADSLTASQQQELTTSIVNSLTTLG